MAVLSRVAARFACPFSVVFCLTFDKSQIVELSLFALERLTCRILRCIFSCMEIELELLTLASEFSI